jgi:hypothetical protein
MSTTAGSAASAIAKASNSRDKEVPWVTIGSTTSGSDKVGKSFATGLGTKLFMKAIGKHLDYESEEMARRVTDNLGWGPGTAVAAAPMPKIAMPVIKAPEPPSFGHMEYGKRDFSALLISTTVNKSKSDTMVMEASIAKAGQKFRSDMDLSKMAKGQQGMPPELSRMVLISRGDKKVAYTLYPNKNRYMTHPETENEGDKPRIEKTKVGSETIDGHPTDKFKVRILHKDDKVYEGFMWNARDLDGMTIKTETENNDFKMTTELKHIVLKRPEASLFEIPSGYTEAKDFMELMMPEKKN